MSKQLVLSTDTQVSNNGEELKQIAFVYHDSSQDGKEVKSNLHQFVSSVRSFDNDMKDFTGKLQNQITTLSDQMLGIRAACKDAGVFKSFCDKLAQDMKWGQGEGKQPQPNWFRDYKRDILAADKVGLVPYQETEITGTSTNDITGEIVKVQAKVTPTNINQLKRFTKAAKKAESTVRKVIFSGFDKGLKMDKTEDAEYITLLRNLSGIYTTHGTSGKAKVLEGLTELMKAFKVASEDDDSHSDNVAAA